MKPLAKPPLFAALVMLLAFAGLVSTAVVSSVPADLANDSGASGGILVEAAAHTELHICCRRYDVPLAAARIH